MNRCVVVTRAFGRQGCGSGKVQRFKGSTVQKVQKVQVEVRSESLCMFDIWVSKKLTTEPTNGGTQSTQRVYSRSKSLCFFVPFCLSGPKLKGFKGSRGSRGSRGSSGGSL